MALLHLDELTVSYGARKALEGVSCHVEGGAVGLLGLNGAGKSTLIKTLLGFLRPASGRAEVLGEAMPRGALRVREFLGYMPERDVMSPRTSAVSFLRYCGRLFGMGRVDAMERAHEVLNYVGVGPERYARMETYSTGMRQRVKFAQALIHRPKLLLLDEPTSGLDPSGRMAMLERIRELATTSGVTVVLSTHLLPDVDQVCDRVVMLHEGRVVRDSPIRDLAQPRAGVFEMRLRNNVERYLARLEARGFQWQRQQDGAIRVTEPNGAGQRALFELAQAEDTQIRHFRAVRRSLEDVFMRAIGRA